MTLSLIKGRSNAMPDPTRQAWLPLSRWKRVLAALEIMREQLETAQGPRAETHKRQITEDINSIKKQILRNGETG